VDPYSSSLRSTTSTPALSLSRASRRANAAWNGYVHNRVAKKGDYFRHNDRPVTISTKMILTWDEAESTPKFFIIYQSGINYKVTNQECQGKRIWKQAYKTHIMAMEEHSELHSRVEPTVTKLLEPILITNQGVCLDFSQIWEIGRVSSFWL
jgi:hypothetical protein